MTTLDKEVKKEVVAINRKTGSRYTFIGKIRKDISYIRVQTAKAQTSWYVKISDVDVIK